MSLNSEITRIETAKEDIKDAIEEMGGEVGEGTIDTYATAVRSIPTGVGTETDPVFTNSPAYGITSNDITSWNGKSTFSGSYNDLTNKPTIPTKLSDLTDDLGSNPTHTHSQYLTSHQTLKTINNQSILGSGNITISEGSSSTYIYTGTDTQTDEDEFISLYENYMSTGNWDLKKIVYKNTSNVIDAQIPMVGATYFRRQYNIYDICEFYFAGYSVNANTGNQNFIFVEVVCTFNISSETTTVGITCTEEVLSKEATSESIAPIYTKGNTYAVGDYVMSNGKLYVCNTAISSAGAWVNESSKWTQTTIIDVIKNI